MHVANWRWSKVLCRKLAGLVPRLTLYICPDWPHSLRLRHPLFFSFGVYVLFTPLHLSLHHLTAIMPRRKNPDPAAARTIALAKQSRRQAQYEARRGKARRGQVNAPVVAAAASPAPSSPDLLITTQGPVAAASDTPPPSFAELGPATALSAQLAHTELDPKVREGMASFLGKH